MNQLGYTKNYEIEGKKALKEAKGVKPEVIRYPRFPSIKFNPLPLSFNDNFEVNHAHFLNERHCIMQEKPNFTSFGFAAEVSRKQITSLTQTAFLLPENAMTLSPSIEGLPIYLEGIKWRH